METHLFCLDTPNALQTPQISNFVFQPKSQHASGCQRSILRQRLRWQKGRAIAVKCGTGDRFMRPESKRKDEIIEEMEDESKDVNEKVELMEMEAIMGKDDGREPMDYKRRAGIFYKSSEMFQAIKENDHQPHHCN